MRMLKLMPWATYELLLAALIGLSCGRATLGYVLCDMSCIVNDNYSK